MKNMDLCTRTASLPALVHPPASAAPLPVYLGSIAAEATALSKRAPIHAMTSGATAASRRLGQSVCAKAATAAIADTTSGAMRISAASPRPGSAAFRSAFASAHTGEKLGGASYDEHQ